MQSAAPQKAALDVVNSHMLMTDSGREQYSSASDYVVRPIRLWAEEMNGSFAP